MSDAAITVIMAGVVQVVVLIIGFLTLWIKLKYGAEQAEKAKKKAEVVEQKIDDNTAITVAGTLAAAQTAQEVKTALSNTEQVTQSLDKKLNGGVDSAIRHAINPIKKTLDEHSNLIEGLNKYVHQRNHEIATALQINNNKLEVLISMVKQQLQNPPTPS